MIISDDYQFCFIHIPKCAGSYARNVLRRYDSYDNYYFFRKHYDGVGCIDLAHLTPRELEVWFPIEFAKAKSYTTYALLRDPAKRFASSFKQFLDTNNKYDRDKNRFEDISPRELRRELDEVIDGLTRGVEMNPRYVHFTRQVDYVYYQGRRFIDALYLVDNIDALYRDIEQRVGKPLNRRLEIGQTRKNASRAYRNDFLRFVFGGVRPYAAKYLPMWAKDAMRPALFVRQSRRKLGVFESETVRGFVQSYYSADIKLYKQLTNRAREQNNTARLL